MGIVANTVETSQFALDIKPFQDTLPRFLLGPMDQPHAMQPFVPLMDVASGIVNDLIADGNAKYADAGFAARTQMGFPAWAGPPGIQESRPIRVQPEASTGALVQSEV